MDEEKKELKLFFAFIHPNQWYGAEPPPGLPSAGFRVTAPWRPREGCRDNLFWREGLALDFIGS